MKLLDKYKKQFESKQTEVMSLQDYLHKLKTDPSLYASPAERMLKAIGEPEVIDTAKDSRLSPIFGNRIIRKYSVFSDFFGMEDTIEQIVSFFQHAAQGLEESKQILYLLGPVGGGKSSLAERLKELMEHEPIYVLTYENEMSPIYESPLNLFSAEDANELGINRRYLQFRMSPWARTKFKEAGGDLNAFTVTKVYPSRTYQISIAKTEPGDENNQDIATLVGEMNLRMLEKYNQNDPKAYLFSGGLCLANQGLLEFVEMFKAPIKMLHPLLTATQEHHYTGTKVIGDIPFDGIIIAHSNLSEWHAFRNDPKNEAFIDRVYIIKVPYNLRVSEEKQIYTKLIENSELKNYPCAPHTLDMLAKFSIFSRIESVDNSTQDLKIKAYNGESIKDKDTRSKSCQEYRELASPMEGMSGISSRFCFKILARVFNFDPTEPGGNAVHLFYILEQALRHESLEEDKEEAYNEYIQFLEEEYEKLFREDMQSALINNSDHGQAVFDRYILYADHWIEDRDFRDPQTGSMYNRENLNKFLSEIEKAAGISNPKDFRHEVVNYVLRYRAKHNGANPDWMAYAKLRKVIEDHILEKTETLIPVLSFDTHKNEDDKRKHEDFLGRMKELGYTAKMVRLSYEWFQTRQAKE